MPLHPRIQDENDLAMLARGLGIATRIGSAQRTSNAGSAFYPNGDGSGVVIGSDAQEFGGAARQLEDGTLAPLVDTSQIDSDLAEAQQQLDANKTAIDQANKDLAQAQSDIAANKTGLVQANKDLAQAKNDIMEAAKDAQDAKAGVATAQSKADKAVSDAASALSVSASANAAAGQASSTAQSAKTTADSAKATADKAAQTASSATSVASTAQQNAATALTNANTALQRAKNITVSSTAPANPTTGDIWYPQDDSGRVIGMKTWDGTSWADVTIMAGSIIVPGSIGSTLIGDGQITTGKLAAGSVTAESMAADAVTARSLAVGDYTNLLDDSLLEKTSTDNQLDSRWEGHNLSWTRNAHVPGGKGNVFVVRKIKDEKFFNPFVQNSQPIPCKGGDTFYAGAYVWYWNDVKATMKVQLKVTDLDNQKTYWLDAGVGTADIGQWQWVDGAATIPSSAGRCIAQIFIFAAGHLNQWTDSDGALQLGYYMVYNPVLRHGVGGTQIADGAVSTSKIVAGSITGDRLAANAVNADKLAANSVTADKLAANSVTADKLAVNSVTADKLASNSVTADKIVANSITGDRLAANAVNADKLAANSVTADKIAAGSITADKIDLDTLNGKTIKGVTITGSEFRTSDDGLRTVLKEENFINYGGTTTHAGILSGMDGDKTMWRIYGDKEVYNVDNRTSYVMDIGINHEILITKPDISKDNIKLLMTANSIDISANSINFYGPVYHNMGYLSAHRTLFHNDNQPSRGVITLDDDITKYWKLEFEFKTNDGVYFGMPVYSPSVGKKFIASTIWYGFDNLPWLKTRAYIFKSSKTVDCVSENNGTYWRTGQQKMDKSLTVSPGDFISVTHVEGFFN